MRAKALRESVRGEFAAFSSCCQSVVCWIQPRQSGPVTAGSAHCRRVTKTVFEQSVHKTGCRASPRSSEYLDGDEKLRRGFQSRPCPFRCSLERCVRERHPLVLQDPRPTSSCPPLPHDTHAQRHSKRPFTRQSAAEKCQLGCFTSFNALYGL